MEYLEIFDDPHSADEDRFMALGPVARGVIVVVFTEQTGDTIRIISARRATRDESDLYRQHVEGES